MDRIAALEDAITALGVAGELREQKYYIEKATELRVHAKRVENLRATAWDVLEILDRDEDPRDMREALRVALVDLSAPVRDPNEWSANIGYDKYIEVEEEFPSYYWEVSTEYEQILVRISDDEWESNPNENIRRGGPFLGSTYPPGEGPNRPRIDGNSAEVARLLAQSLNEGLVR